MRAGRGQSVDGQTLLVANGRRPQLLAESADWPVLVLDAVARADFESLVTGVFGPLPGYLSARDVASITATGRTAGGHPCPVPVLLALPPAIEDPPPGSSLALRDEEGLLLGRVQVDDVFWLEGRASRYVGGPVEALRVPLHHDFPELRRTPAALRAEASGVDVAAHFPDGVLHRPQLAGLLQAAGDLGAELLVLDCVGGADPTDSGHFTRVRAQQAALSDAGVSPLRYGLVPLLPAAPTAATILRNAMAALMAGASQLLLPSPVGAELQARIRALGVTPRSFDARMWNAGPGVFVPATAAPANALPPIAREELERRLAAGAPLPSWHTPPAVMEELRRLHPPRSEQGFTVFFTGLSGSGKSTIANILRVRLLERGRRVTLLDGDLVRRHLSSELGFSPEHRNVNVRRIGFVASQITWHGGIALCAPIAPYAAARRAVREMVGAAGGFVLVHVDTPLAVCEQRDPKGLYAKARAGRIPEFTGVSDPYEPPDDADVVVDTRHVGAAAAADLVIAHLEAEGYLGDKRGRTGR